MADNRTTLQEVQNLDNLSKTCKTNADRAQSIGKFLKDQTNNMFWESKAATSFTQRMGEYQTTLTNIQTQLTSLSTELSRRADVLRASENV